MTCKVGSVVHCIDVNAVLFKQTCRAKLDGVNKVNCLVRIGICDILCFLGVSSIMSSLSVYCTEQLKTETSQMAPTKQSFQTLFKEVNISLFLHLVNAFKINSVNLEVNDVITGNVS